MILNLAVLIVLVLVVWLWLKWPYYFYKLEGNDPYRVMVKPLLGKPFEAFRSKDNIAWYRLDTKRCVTKDISVYAVFQEYHMCTKIHDENR